VIRILKPLELLNLEELGFDGETTGKIRSLLRKPHGMILVTGPTGSGKTTTLYACLKELNTLERKIITIEDPIEYKLPGIIQIQANPKIGLTFTQALRSMLRHDPDCLMIGEIRDPETAEIAIRSALTGHLVLSTLHTNDAPSAVTRLLEMGIEPYLVSSSLGAVIAQRLVRQLCPPCPQCYGSGYYGRTAIYESMTLTPDLQRLVLKREASEEIRKEALREGMTGLLENGMKKVRSGLTTEEEIARVVSSIA
jgi:type II secretory ATPase GspE/PulE/Tfp pilus assembly ATPase PilB-like protein